MFTSAQKFRSCDPEPDRRDPHGADRGGVSASQADSRPNRITLPPVLAKSKQALGGPRMKASRFGVVIVSALLLVGVGTALATNAPPAHAATVAGASSGLGRILVD